MQPKELADKIAQLMLDKKAEDVVTMDLRELTAITDFFVVCSASSDVQVKAIADHIENELGKVKENVWHSEGYTNRSWVLLDYVNVVAHIFLNQTRKFYNLENLWGDAVIEEVQDK
jgi:ribosome-associated protein